MSDDGWDESNKLQQLFIERCAQKKHEFDELMQKESMMAPLMFFITAWLLAGIDTKYYYSICK